MVSKEEVEQSFIEAFLLHLTTFDRQMTKRKERSASYTEDSTPTRNDGTTYDPNDNIKIRRMDSLARILNGYDSENCTAVCLYNNKLYITANTVSPALGNRISDLKVWLSGYPKPDMPGGELLKNNRLKRDFYKIFQSVNNWRRRKVFSITKSGKRREESTFIPAYHMPELRLLINNDDDVVKIVENPKGLHAEMCLLDYLITLETSFIQQREIIFGISKLCCKLCSCAMNAAGLVNGLNYRAGHGNFYNNWVMPSFISSRDETILSAFLGGGEAALNPKLLGLIPKKLRQKTQRGSSSASMSDSEAEY